MSRSFNGSSQALQSAAALADLAGAKRIAISFHMKSTFAGDDDMTAELGNASAGGFMLLHNESGVNRTDFALRGAAGLSGDSIPTPSSGVWHHYLWNADFDNSGTTESETIYMDGVLVTNSDAFTNDNTGQTFASLVLNLMSRNGTSLWQDGELVDFCIWRIEDDTPLTVDHAAALAGGARAIDVRPADIAYYWPLAGTDSPEPALVGGVALNLIGAPVGTADPPGMDPVPGLAGVECTVTRTDFTEATVEWDDPVGDDYGMSILRATGAHLTDASGDSFGDAGYDPTTISGATIIATGETSPYVDTGLDEDLAYSYALIRTGPDA